MSFVKEFLISNWHTLFKDAQPKSIDLAKLPSRPDHKSSISFLIFVNEMKEPKYLLKINRDPTYKDAIVSEYNNFSCIYNALKTAGSSVPKPIFLKEDNYGHIIFCQTALKGRKIGYALFTKRHFKSKVATINRFIEASFEWLARFHLETTSQYEVIDERFIQKYTVELIEKFHSKSKQSKNRGLENKFDGIADLLKSHIGAKIPICSIHGDFDYSNILVDGCKIKVVDWEDCQRCGLPFRDIFFFIAQLGLNFYPNLLPIQSFRNFFENGSWTKDAIDKGLSIYSKATSLDKEIIYHMFPFFILELLMKVCNEHRDPRSYLFRSNQMLDIVLDMSLKRI